MLLRVIDKIRQKPRAVRQQYAFVLAVSFTAVVTLIWSLSLPARFLYVQEEFSDIAIDIEPISQTATVPFAGVWTQLKKQLFGVTNDSKTNSTIITDPTENSFVSPQQPPKKASRIELDSGTTITFGSLNSLNSNASASTTAVE